MQREKKMQFNSTEIFSGGLILVLAAVVTLTICEGACGSDSTTTMTVNGRKYVPQQWQYTGKDTAATVTPERYYLVGESSEGEGIEASTDYQEYAKAKDGSTVHISIHKGGVFGSRTATVIE